MENLTEAQKRIEECRATQATTLDLSGLALTRIPDEVFTLTHLIELNLGRWNPSDPANNRISEMPAAIENLQKLTRLYLSNNQLSTLPDAVTRLQNLTRLDLSNNQLSTLPDAVTRLQNLTELYLSNNQLSTLPDAVTRLEKLKLLDVADNPLLNPPLEVASGGIDAIRTYFAKFGAIDHLYEAKLLLVGEGRVGKTSLQKALTTLNYTLTDERSTEGIDIQQWLIPASETGLVQDFRLNTWDFGGQEIYHHTHQFFLTRRSLYLLVTESRKEDKHDDFYYWLNIIRLLGGASPVIMVLNKIDQPTKELPIKEYQEQFDNIVDYQRVSCAPGYGDTIRALKGAIRRWLLDARRMGHVGAPLPAAWVAIRQALAVLQQAGKDHISRGEFLALCQQHDLDGDIALVLSRYFHDIGVFLHFDDDVVLSETVFLNHDYVTTAVYKVLDNEAVKRRHGRFSDADLKTIWHEERYRAKRPELLALMMNDKFELCYRLPSGGYLAPQLLPVDEQPYSWRSPADNLHFEYRYPFMPKGILPRFIVKRHQDIHEQIQWRAGVLLAWGDTRALVRERYFERKLTIVVEGNNKRGLLEIIRKTIEEIHASFHDLACQEMIPCNCPGCRASAAPAFYAYTLLTDYQKNGVSKIRCTQHVRNEVSVQALFNDVFLPPPPEREEEERWRDLHVHGDFVLRDKTIGGDQVGGDKVGGDKLAGDKVGGDKLLGEHVVPPLGAAAENAGVGGPDPALAVPAVWIDRAVYLALAALLLALVAYLGNQVAGYVVLLVFIAGILAVGGVGALHLRQEEQLSTQGWRALLAGVYRRLPLWRGRG